MIKQGQIALKIVDSKAALQATETNPVTGIGEYQASSTSH